MIPQAYITEWGNNVPWQTNEQIEQDLIISRAIVEIFSDNFLASHLAFRGGTAIHKLFLKPPSRYSEDLDLVQINREPFGSVIDQFKKCLQFLGDPKVQQKESITKLLFRFDSEFLPIQKLRLKVETHFREHIAVLGLHPFFFEVKSSWFTGSCNIITYKLEELLGTKLRALYQRKKGRDLYDIYKALKSNPDINKESVLLCYHKYMEAAGKKSPSQKQFIENLESKMINDEFRGDITALIKMDEKYDQTEAYELVKMEFIEKI